MPLQATSGAASYDGFGGGVAAVPNYIEDVFSTWLYTGNGTTNTITNNIDLSTKGGLVWMKSRNSGTYHGLYDTVRGTGTGKSLYSNTTEAQGTNSIYQNLTAFNTTGFTLGSTSSTNALNGNGDSYVSWTFRKQPKFFDIVTYTGDGTAGRTVAHNLGSTPGCIIVKTTNTTNEWAVYHRSLGATQYMYLNTTGTAQTASYYWNDTAPTSTNFTVGDSGRTNGAGNTYVAYIFAHNAGGFGLTGTDNVISCGSYTGNGVTTGPTVTLGYEPQLLIVKKASDTADWFIYDNMRNSGSWGTRLNPNLPNAENSNAQAQFDITATGFFPNSLNNSSNSSTNTDGATYIYIAIRRGPMKVPTDGTKVFAPVTQNGGGFETAGFPVDLMIDQARSAATGAYWQDRLRGGNATLTSATTGAEQNFSGIYTFDNETGVQDNWFGVATSVAYWNFRRAPGFFDEVCYTGTGANTTFAHNLGVAPELMIIKSRSDAFAWRVYTAPTGNTGYMVFNANDAFGTSSATWNNTSPTSSVFTVGTPAAVNNSGSTFVAYLFASVAGVSKVGSYTGTGSTLTVDCGFPSGVRFVMVKRTNNLGSWWVWDTARGMVSGTDPRLAFNSTSAETNTNWVYSVSTGFQVVSTNSEVNNAGDTYIYLAIA